MSDDVAMNLGAVEAFQAPLEAAFQKRPLVSWDSVDRRFGDSFFDLDGQPIRRGQVIRRNQRLPAILDNRRTVVGDLIPPSSFGSNLANLLTKASWDGLRHPLIAANNNVCELCGQRFETLDVHEIWDYHFPAPSDCEKRFEYTVFGVQELVGLAGVCVSCHEMFHLGLANVNGRLDVVLERLAAINGWAESHALAYDNALVKRGQIAGEFGWVLDCGRIRHPEGGFKVKAPWTLDPDNPYLLTAPSDYGARETALLNVKWKFAAEKDWRPPVSAAELGE